VPAVDHESPGAEPSAPSLDSTESGPAAEPESPAPPDASAHAASGEPQPDAGHPAPVATAD
jgi:hypothetical protein